MTFKDYQNCIKKAIKAVKKANKLYFTRSGDNYYFTDNIIVLKIKHKNLFHDLRQQFAKVALIPDLADGQSIFYNKDTKQVEDNGLRVDVIEKFFSEADYKQAKLSNVTIFNGRYNVKTVICDSFCATLDQAYADIMEGFEIQAKDKNNPIYAKSEAIDIVCMPIMFDDNLYNDLKEIAKVL